jgi:hypothetical protein
MCWRFHVSLYVYEVLEKAAEASTKEEKVAILRQHESLALKTILRGGMDSTIEFLLPEGTPPYTPEGNPDGYTRSTIQRQAKKFSYFVKGGKGDNVKPLRREKMFIDVIESVHPKEAELIILMKDKSLIKKTGTAHYKGITKKLVQEAFPNLIKD